CCLHFIPGNPHVAGLKTKWLFMHVTNTVHKEWVIQHPVVDDRLGYKLQGVTPPESLRACDLLPGLRFTGQTKACHIARVIRSPHIHCSLRKQWEKLLRDVLSAEVVKSEQGLEAFN